MDVALFGSGSNYCSKNIGNDFMSANLLIVFVWEVVLPTQNKQALAVGDRSSAHADWQVYVLTKHECTRSSLELASDWPLAFTKIQCSLHWFLSMTVNAIYLQLNDFPDSYAHLLASCLGLGCFWLLLYVQVNKYFHSENACCECIFWTQIICHRSHGVSRRQGWKREKQKKNA